MVQLAVIGVSDTASKQPAAATVLIKILMTHPRDIRKYGRFLKGTQACGSCLHFCINILDKHSKRHVHIHSLKDQGSEISEMETLLETGYALQPINQITVELRKEITVD